MRLDSSLVPVALWFVFAIGFTVGAGMIAKYHLRKMREIRARVVQAKTEVDRIRSAGL